MKVKVLDKYKWYYERLIKIENYLTIDKKNAYLINGSKQIEKHTIKNYPGGNLHVREALKKTHLQLAENNYKIYLTSQNRRMHKFSKPLTGYVEDADLKRLENLRRKVFSYQNIVLDEDEMDEGKFMGRRAEKKRYQSAEVNDDQRD